jgi:hypothetical protein
MILTGQSVYARRPEDRLADEVTFKETLIDRALAIAKCQSEDRGPGRWARRPLLIKLAEGNKFIRPLIFRSAKENVLDKSRENYPASRGAESVRFDSYKRGGGL